MEERKPSKFKRSSEIAKIFAHYGFEFLDENPAWWTYLVAPKKLFSGNNTQQHTPAERVRLAIEELGATYIKLGQAASTRPDLVPPEYIKELSKLQDNTPPVPYADIAHVVKEELKFTPETKFGCFEKEPLGSASIGQVHRAILSDGSEVVVKVQRPHLREKIDADLAVLHDLVEFLHNRYSADKAVDVKGWFSEFEFSLINELDFTKEGRNADRFRKNFKDDPALYVPKIYWDYTTSRVLTMEEVVGTKISDTSELEAKGIDRRQLARTAALIVLKMVYEHGFFHADPHAGNFFVTDDGRIALIDYGMVGSLDDELKSSLMRIALAAARRDADQLTDEVLSFAYSSGRIDREALKRDITRTLVLNLDTDSRNVSLARLLNETLAAAARQGLMVPSSIAMLARCLTMAEGLGSMLDPDFNLAMFAEPYLEEIFAKRYSREAMLERAKLEGPFLADLILRFPKRTERVLSRVERGEFAVITRVDQQDEILRQFHMAANRISMSLLTAGLTVALSVLTIVYRPSQMHGLWATLLTTMLLAICSGGVILLVSIWRSGK